MPITVGRLSLPGPRDPSVSGSSFSWQGLIHELSQAATNATIRQIAGLTDEGLVPVIWSPGEWSGFHRVKAASAEIAYVTAGRSAVRYSIQTDYIGAQPYFDSSFTGAILATNGVAWDVLPVDTDARRYTPPWMGAPIALTSEDGGLYRVLWTTPTVPTSARWTVTPAGWYLGSVLLKVGGYSVVGRNAPSAPTSWVLSNGLVRVSPSGGALLVEYYQGGAWRTSGTWDVSVAGNALGNWNTLEVLRNSPEEVSIRLVSRAALNSMLTLTLQRGSRYVTAALKPESGTTIKFAQSAGATTSTTHGVYSSTSDAQGYRWFVSTPSTFTVSGAGIQSEAAATSFVVNLGSAPAAGSVMVDEVNLYSMSYLGRTVRPVPVRSP